ncbi:MAG: hypothetical protein HS115_11580 [Spirochaetales bacterium]|nr:hypothetical protein [Spirochaetales bacterium]
MQFARQQVKVGLATMAMALKTIRDQKLFLIENCGSMHEWLLTNFQSSYTTFKNLMTVADRFADSSDAQQVLSQPITHLLLYARHEETAQAISDGSIQFQGGKVVLEDGTEISAKDFAKQIRNELKSESGDEAKKLDHKLKQKTAQLSAKDSVISTLQEDLEQARQRAADLEKALIETKDIDPARLVYITHKKDAIQLLTDVAPQVIGLMGQIDGMSADAVDAEVAGHFARSLSAIEASLENLKNRWGGIIWGHQTARETLADESDLVPQG